MCLPKYDRMQTACPRTGVTYCLNHLGWCWQILENMQTMRCGWFVSLASSRVSTVPCSGSGPSSTAAVGAVKPSSRGWAAVLRNSKKRPWYFAFYRVDPKYFFPPFFPERLTLRVHHYQVSVAPIYCSTAVAWILFLQRTPRFAWEAYGIFFQDTAFAACRKTHWFVPSPVAVPCTAMNRHH